MADDTIDRFLAKATEKGYLSAERARECRGIVEVLRGLDDEMTVDRVAVKKEFLTRAQADEVLRAIARRRVGRYEVVERLGAGGMGQVWRARDVESDLVVALKLLAAKKGKSDENLQRFLREARLSCKLDHPNLVHGIEFGEAAGYTYLALEFVPGENLEQRIEREERITEREAFGIARQVLAALEHLSTFELVHRDVKPANVLLNAEGGVKLCDMGLTRAPLREADEVGVREIPLGTAFYVAPEQVSRPDHIDWRADAYSLGCTLYHALTGRPPFVSDKSDALVKMHQETAPRDPREFVLEITPGAATVVLKLLHKDPAGRYGTMQDLAEDLEAVRDGHQPTHTLSVAPVPEKRAPPPVSRPQKHGPSARVARRGGGKGAMVGGVIGVVVLGAAGAFLLMGGDKEPATPPTTPPPDVEAPDAVATPLPPGPTEEPDATEPATSGGGGTTGARPSATGGTDWQDGSPAAEALNNVERYWAENPEAWSEIGKRLAFVVKTHAGTAAGERAVQRTKDLAKAREKAAAAELGQRREGAAMARQAGRYREAWETFKTFPLDFHDTKAGAEAREETALAAQAAEKRLAELAAEAAQAAAELRFEDADRAVADAEIVSIPGGATSAKDVRRIVEEARAEQERLQEEQLPLFEAVFGDVLRSAAGGDRAAAVARMEESRPQIDRLPRKLEALADAVEAATRAHGAVVDRWAAAKGRDVTLGVPGRPGGRVTGKCAGVRDGRLLVSTGSGEPLEFSMAEIGPADAVRLADEALAVGGPADRFAVIVTAIARGRLTAASARMQSLASDAALSEGAQDLIDTMRRHLDARVSDMLDTAGAARDAGDAEGALQQVRSAVAIAPEDPRAAVALGRALLEARRPADAAAAMESVLDGGSGPLHARVILAEALVATGDLIRARDEYARFLADATTDDPQRPTVEQALEILQGRLAAEVADDLAKEAGKLHRRKKWAEAEALYLQVLTHRPDDPDASLSLAECYEGQNKVFEAYRQYTRFLKAHPKSRDAKKAEKQLASLETYKRINESDRETAAKGDEALGRQDWDGALSLYRNALVWSPFLDAARLGIARSLLGRYKARESREDLSGAVAALDDVLLLREDHIDALTLRARALLRLGRVEAALEDATRVTAADKANPEPVLVAAHCQYRMGNVDRAGELFEKAFVLRPSGEAVYGRGLVHEYYKRFDEALAAFQEATTTFTVEPDIRREVDAAVLRVRARLR